MTKQEIGNALDRFLNDVKANALDLVSQYDTAPARLQPDLIKQAVDTPHRANAQVQVWITAYNTANGAGTATTFLNSCLTAAGSTQTVASINTALQGLESQAQTLVDNVNNSGWTWAQVAAAIKTALAVTTENFSYVNLPIPSGYTDVWGQTW